MTTEITVKSALLLVWVVAIILMTANVILVWQQKPVNKSKRTMSCVILAVLFAVPCALFLLSTPL